MQKVFLVDSFVGVWPTDFAYLLIKKYGEG